MGFLLEKCKLSVLTEDIRKSCYDFSCGKEDMDEFFCKDYCDYAFYMMGKSYYLRQKNKRNYILFQRRTMKIRKKGVNLPSFVIYANNQFATESIAESHKLTANVVLVESTFLELHSRYLASLYLFKYVVHHIMLSLLCLVGIIPNISDRKGKIFISPKRRFYIL